MGKNCGEGTGKIFTFLNKSKGSSKIFLVNLGNFHGRLVRGIPSTTSSQTSLTPYPLWACMLQKTFQMFFSFQFFERVSKRRSLDEISMGQHSHVRKQRFLGCLNNQVQMSINLKSLTILKESN